MGKLSRPALGYGMGRSGSRDSREQAGEELRGFRRTQRRAGPYSILHFALPPCAGSPFRRASSSRR